ncbi:hypothetical protein Tco_1555878 [Tanacetum coccineum]
MWCCYDDDDDELMMMMVMTAETAGGGGGKWRVAASGVVGWVDRKKRNTFGVRWKNPPEKFFGGSRRWPEKVGEGESDGSTGYSQKDEKQVKTDKTKNGMEKRGKDKAKSKPKTKWSTPEKSTVKTGADTEEYLMGPPEPI